MEKEKVLDKQHVKRFDMAANVHLEDGSKQMTKIAFITINRGLVHLIEGLCAPILIIKDLRLSVVCVYIFCFSFSEGKKCYRKKQLVQDLILPSSIL